MYRIWSFLVAIALVLADQLTKSWIRTSLAPGESFFQFGFFRIDNIRNTGAAFGLFPTQSTILAVISSIGTVALVALVIYSNRVPFFQHRLTSTALGMVLAGTVGNLIDRVLFGYVTDFIDFTYFPAFNIADASIDIGVFIFAVAFLLASRHK